MLGLYDLKMQRSSTLTSRATILLRPVSVSYAARTTLHAPPPLAARRRPNSSLPTEADCLPTGSRSLEPSISKVLFPPRARDTLSLHFLTLRFCISKALAPASLLLQ